MQLPSTLSKRQRPKINQSLPVVLEEPVVIELLNNYPTTTHEMIRNKVFLNYYLHPEFVLQNWLHYQSMI